MLSLFACRAMRELSSAQMFYLRVRVHVRMYVCMVGLRIRNDTIRMDVWRTNYSFVKHEKRYGRNVRRSLHVLDPFCQGYFCQFFCQFCLPIFQTYTPNLARTEVGKNRQINYLQIDPILSSLFGRYLPIFCTSTHPFWRQSQNDQNNRQHQD